MFRYRVRCVHTGERFDFFSPHRHAVGDEFVYCPEVGGACLVNVEKIREFSTVKKVVMIDGYRLRREMAVMPY